jgi:aminoglycoside 6-adenylyltransferase
MTTVQQQILTNIIRWAENETAVRRLLLVGSRALPSPPDDLADFDIQVYAESLSKYTDNAEWLRAIGPRWLCVHDQYVDGSVQVQTRLVIFTEGVKVDFAFYPAETLSSGIQSGLPYRALVSKGSRDEDAAESTASIAPARPVSDAGFRLTVEEFWFEAYHVAKYLARGELWLAKSRDWAVKQLLWSMIAWHEEFVRGRVCHPMSVGKRACVGEDTWQALHSSFAGFRAEESWDAAFQTIDLFRRLAREVAAVQGFTYPEDIDANVFGWIVSVREAHTLQTSWQWKAQTAG